ncbi:MAG: glycosyltransferase family 2 protein [Geminicoccaceae bacterium]
MTRHAGVEEVCVVVPVHDEEETIPTLVDRLLKTPIPAPFRLARIVLIDDGSRDRSWAVMAEIAASHEQVDALRLRRNFGKATALQTAIDQITEPIIVTMDADLQDDPDELAKLLAALTADVDLVSGWKQNRQDPLSKTLPSKLFNKITSLISGLPLHDFNCGYKVYRREIFVGVQLYGELHRYVPVLAHALGYRVAEVPVRHHPRQHGRSKYGAGRLLKGLIDLLTVLMLTRFAQRPAHLFGGIGVTLGGVGFAILIYLTGFKLITGADIGQRPLLQLGILLSIIGVQVLLFGVLAELIVSRRRPHNGESLIRERIGHDRRTREPAGADGLTHERAG